MGQDHRKSHGRGRAGVAVRGPDRLDDRPPVPGAKARGGGDGCSSRAGDGRGRRRGRADFAHELGFGPGHLGGDETAAAGPLGRRGADLGPVVHDAAAREFISLGGGEGGAVPRWRGAETKAGWVRGFRSARAVRPAPALTLRGPPHCERRQFLDDDALLEQPAGYGPQPLRSSFLRPRPSIPGSLRCIGRERPVLRGVVLPVDPRCIRPGDRLTPSISPGRPAAVRHCLPCQGHRCVRFLGCPRRQEGVGVPRRTPPV
mmetsp:Transcript_5819/g.16762  ORF Transcript_5819/g.16762 Transcript_5819/m.16762 type:complete len:259 (-) Transcript_5819:1019-1795(-)